LRPRQKNRIGKPRSRPAARLRIDALESREVPTNLAFVTSLYRIVLSRVPAASEVAPWVHFLDNGGTRDVVARSFWESAEHRGLQVDGFYQRFFHGTESAPERAAWIAAFTQGMSDLQIEQLFVTSGE
jgi:hypothetical protein